MPLVVTRLVPAPRLAVRGFIIGLLAFLRLPLPSNTCCITSVIVLNRAPVQTFLQTRRVYHHAPWRIALSEPSFQNPRQRLPPNRRCPRIAFSDFSSYSASALRNILIRKSRIATALVYREKSCFNPDATPQVSSKSGFPLSLPIVISLFRYRAADTRCNPCPAHKI